MRVSVSRWAFFVVMCLSASTGCKSKAEKAKEAEEAPRIVADFTTKLRSIRAQLPEPGTLAEMTCDDGAITKALGPGKKTIGAPHVDVEFLAELEGGPRREFGVGSAKPLWLLNSTRMQLFSRQTRPGQIDLVGAADEVKGAIDLGGNLLVVFQTLSFKEPEALESGFESGHYDGWALVYGLERGDRLCQARIHAENSDEVKFKRGKVDTATHQDLMERIEREIDASLKRISPRLRVTF